MYMYMCTTTTTQCSDRLLLRGTFLKNTAWVKGVVVYTGQETPFGTPQMLTPPSTTLSVCGRSVRYFIGPADCSHCSCSHKSFQSLTPDSEAGGRRLGSPCNLLGKNGAFLRRKKGAAVFLAASSSRSPTAGTITVVQSSCWRSFGQHCSNSVPSRLSQIRTGSARICGRVD